MGFEETVRRCRWLVAVAALCLVAACGADREPGVSADEGRSPGADLAGGPWESWAATDSTVFGLAEPRHPDGGDVSTFGISVDVTSAERADLPAPPGEGYFFVQESVGGARELLVAGVWCPTPVLDESTVCEPVSSYAWDPDGNWRSLAVPASTEFLSDLVVDEDGRFWAVLIGGRKPSRVAVLEGVAWRVVGELPHPENIEICISGDTAYSLGRLLDLSGMAPAGSGAAPQGSTPSTETTAGLGTPATVTVTAFSLGGGSSEELGTPALFGGFGGRGVQLGCTPDGPVVTTVTPDRQVELHRWHEGGWLAPPELLAGGAPAVVTNVVTTPSGALVVYTTGSERERRPEALAVTEAGSSPVSGSFADVELVPLGTTGRLAAISPESPDPLRIVDLM